MGQNIQFVSVPFYHEALVLEQTNGSEIKRTYLSVPYGYLLAFVFGDSLVCLVMHSEGRGSQSAVSSDQH